MKNVCILILIIISAALPSEAKRSAPKEVKPIRYEGVQYVVVHWAFENGTGQNGGYIEARNSKTGKKLWGVLVYKVKYRDDWEHDIQDVFIKDIQIDRKNKLLLATNELDEEYRIDIETGKAIHVVDKLRKLKIVK